MNYLITGGAGFIGSHLVKRLIEASEFNHVTVVDNCCTGSLRNIEEFIDHKQFVYKAYDVEHGLWLSAFRGEEIMRLNGIKKPDVIFNLACPASPVAYQKTPVNTTMTSVLGTYHALTLAKEFGARILQASTSEVYGDPTVHPQPEWYWGNVNSFGPRSCYDEGKRCAESLVYDFRQAGTDTRLVRIFNTYGPNMAKDDGRVVSNFIVQALKGEPLTIYGDGSQTRSFCYVDDLVEGLLAVMQWDDRGPVNLGNPGEFTMLQLAQMVLSITNSSSIIEYRSLPTDDPRQRRPDIAKAKEIGWEPKTALYDGLIKTVDYFRGKV